MKDALAIHRWLLSHQIHHEIVRLPRALTCADDLPAILHADPACCIRVSVFEVTIRGSRAPVAVVTTVASPPRAGAVGALLGARKVRPAPAFLVNSATDYAETAVSPLLLPPELTVLIDERLTNWQHPGDLVYAPTGERHTALRMKVLDLLSVTPGKYVNLRAPRHTTPRVPASRDARPVVGLPCRESPPALL
ncbi:aminoacyl-tRNA deacylase [Sphaerisporangium fuscum]|uniref:aminoacyl-tRNA deacylase n=1 Tax=Sphaerisporangium fuscum TaxID=2835868 RepID=UPI001BDD5B7B|nr:YbaK/EbsC family protein [Sphaerisporangium fuscum]